MGFFELFAGTLAGFYALIPSLGLAIILLTLAVRAVLLPLSIKQTKSMREMQVIQPEVKRIQQKHKNDRQKMNEEMMALYKEHGVNPFGGCLPLVMQIPVFIGLYQVVREPLKYLGYVVPESGAPVLQDLSGKILRPFIEVLQSSSLAGHLLDDALSVSRFLGLRLDCSLTEAWAGRGSPTIDTACGTGTPIIAALPYAVLILVMGFTTYYQQRQMTASRGANDPQAQQMQMIGKVMPVLLIVFGLNFPAGVVVYWLTTNIWTIGQQRLILGKFGPPPSAGGKQAPKGSDKGGKAATGKGGAKDKPKAGSKAGNGSKGGGKPSGTKKAAASSGKQGANGQKTGAGQKNPAASKKKRRR